MQKKNPPEELNLSEACELLKVSEKTIRKYIKLRKISASKVGRVWYIDKASLIQFKENNTPDHQATEADSKPNIPAIPAGAAIHKLACYRLFLTALHQFDYSKEPEDLIRFFSQQSRECLALLGAGYYAYGRTKKNFYEMARAAIGKIIAILASNPDLYLRHYKSAQFLENDVLPAFGSLMRKLEKGHLDPHRSRGGSAPETDRVP